MKKERRKAERSLHVEWTPPAFCKMYRCIACRGARLEMAKGVVTTDLRYRTFLVWVLREGKRERRIMAIGEDPRKLAQAMHLCPLHTTALWEMVTCVPD